MTRLAGRIYARTLDRLLTDRVATAVPTDYQLAMAAVCTSADLAAAAKAWDAAQTAPTVVGYLAGVAIARAGSLSSPGSHAVPPTTAPLPTATLTTAAVKDALEALIGAMARSLAMEAMLYRRGSVTAAEWLTTQLQVIKCLHTAAVMAAVRMHALTQPPTPVAVTLPVVAALEAITRQHYAYARRMVLATLEGRQRLNGRLDARAASYAAAARTTYEYVLRGLAQLTGTRYERNVLHAAESCRHCAQQTALGWVPVGTLTPIGERGCMHNCRCMLEFSNAPSLHTAPP